MQKLFLRRIDVDTENKIIRQSGADVQHKTGRLRLWAAMILAQISGLGGLAIPVAHAQEQLVLEEIIVTARRREENLQEVPIAITAFSDDYLRENNITELSDIQTHVPSLNVGVGGSSTNAPVISLRGQRPSEVLITLDPAVPLYFADVVLTPTQGTNLSMYDLQNVQVLKGPQGTLFGRNSTGGAVLFTPKRPGEELGGYIEAKAGDFDLLSLEGAIDIPVSDSLQLRLAAKKTDRDGYQSNVADNALNGDDQFWDEDSSAARLTIQFQPTDVFENLTVLDWNDNEMKARVPTPLAFSPDGATFGCQICPVVNLFFNSGANEGLIDEALARQQGRDWNDIETDLDGRETVENTFVANTTTWDVSDNVTIKNIFGYRKLEYTAHNDTDGTGLPMFGSITEGDQNSIGTVTGSDTPSGETDAEQFSNELQVLVTMLDERLEWIFGGYYFEMDGSQESPTQILSIVPQNSPRGEVENTAYALFSEATYTFSDQWALTLGLRQSYDEREATVMNTRRDTCIVDDPNAPGTKLPDDMCARTESEDFDSPTWRIAASYTPTDAMLLYGSISAGYRAGGFNLRGTIDEELVPFDEETVTTYEIGHKTDWHLGDSSLVRTNIAIFFQDYQDIQKTQAVSTESGGFGTATVNAAEATIQGLELEVLFIPIDGLDISLSYAYVDTEYDEWEQLNQNTGLLDDISDREFTWIPEHSATATVRYRLPLDESIGELSLGASYYYQSEVRAVDQVNEFNIPDIDNGPLNATIEQDSYGVWDIRVDWASIMQSNFDLAAWVKNGGDEEYAVGGLNVLTSLGWSANVYGPPRTVGASLRYRF